MQVRVISENLEVLWVKTEAGGLTSLSYRRDGTLEQIIAALESALRQARAEATQVDVGDHSKIVSAEDIDALLQRDLLVDVRADKFPYTGGLEERMPLGWSDEADSGSGRPDCNSMPCKSCAVDGSLK